MKGRYCGPCDRWWAHRITKECPACGADTDKGEIPADEMSHLNVTPQRKTLAEQWAEEDEARHDEGD